MRKKLQREDSSIHEKLVCSIFALSILDDDGTGSIHIDFIHSIISRSKLWYQKKKLTAVKSISL